MPSFPRTLLDQTFRDEDGRIVLAQWPNIPIVGWLIFKALSVFTTDWVSHTSAQVSTAFLFTWAYLEITQGVNYFRRALGVVAMAAIVWGFAA